MDEENDDRNWKNWAIKTFTPVKASSRVHGVVKTYNFSGYSKELYDLKDQLEKKDSKYEDLNFRPTMASLRGFGADCTWE